MLFSSLTFIYLFLPICLFLYFLTPKKYRNYTLLFFSILFYGFETPKFIIMICLCILITYINGLIINKYRNKAYFIVSIILSLIPLFFFKYTNFFIENINNITTNNIPLLNIVLPLGISFYTFQMLTYIIDLWKEKISVEKNLFNFALYVIFFPQLIAGPIVKYSDMQKQIYCRNSTIETVGMGIFIFAIGLGKKVLIANQLGELCSLYNFADTTILMTWLYGIAYSLQIYFDFSGYSTMAIGIGKIFGFELPENFNYPYMCSSIKDFWKRWHMTLSSFFKEYVYIPLGGNRVKTSRYILNMFIVWSLTGFWHGASWNFIVWGLLFFVILMIENFVIKNKMNKIVQRVLSLIIIIISFIIFGANDLPEAMISIKNLFVGQFLNDKTLFALRNFGFIVLVAIISATPLLKQAYNKYLKDFKYNYLIEPTIILLLLLTSTAYLLDGSFNPFLYFRF